MWGEDGWRSHRLVSYRARYLRFRYILFFYAPIQARILFETFFGVEGVESSPRSCAKEFRHLGLGPFVLPQPGITGRYLQQECGAAASVRAGIPHPFKCAAAAVQLLSHPPLSHPQTHPVGVRTCYRTPSFITPPNTPCGCADVLSHPLVYHTPLGPPASCSSSPGVHKISYPPQDTTPGDNVLKSQNVITGVCYLVSVTVTSSQPQ